MVKYGTLDATRAPVKPALSRGSLNAIGQVLTDFVEIHDAGAYQITVLATDNSGGLGEADSISYSFNTPGEYYVRISGMVDPGTCQTPSFLAPPRKLENRICAEPVAAGSR